MNGLRVLMLGVLASGCGPVSVPAVNDTVQRSACNAGNVSACKDVGMRAYRAKQFRVATSYLKTACDGADYAACCTLGSLHWAGRGVPKSLKKAESLQRLGCQGETAGCCTNLGALYMREPSLGVSGPPLQAIFEKGCAAGHMVSCLNLGALHEYGQGIEKRPERAVVLYGQACDGGVMPACMSLGRLHQRGVGVAQNSAQALALYRKACAGKHWRACKAKKGLEGVEACRSACGHSATLVAAAGDLDTEGHVEALNRIKRVQPRCMEYCVRDGALNTDCAIKARTFTDLVPCHSFSKKKR